jgi:hypothetical protein
MTACRAITTQPSPGGDGFVCVTVILSNAGANILPYKGHFGNK